MSFSQGPHGYFEIWKGSTRLILVNFLFLKSTQNFLWNGSNFVFVAICGGSSHILTGLNSSVMEASVVYGEWRWQPNQNLLNSVFIPYIYTASVIEYRSIGNCSSSGLCAGLMITGHHFQLLLTLPPSDTECQ